MIFVEQRRSSVFIRLFFRHDFETISARPPDLGRAVGSIVVDSRHDTRRPDTNNDRRVIWREFQNVLRCLRFGFSTLTQLRSAQTIRAHARLPPSLYWCVLSVARQPNDDATPRTRERWRTRVFFFFMGWGVDLQLYWNMQIHSCQCCSQTIYFVLHYVHGPGVRRG